MSTTNKTNSKFYEKLKMISTQVDGKTKLKIWLKTLLFSYKSIPEIIKAVDSIITLRASNLSFSNQSYLGGDTTYNQIEKVLDLSERKNSLLNIRYMIDELLSKLGEDEKDFIQKKFFLGYTVQELSEDYQISERSIFRKCDKVLDDLYKICINLRFSLIFIESQIKEEYWLKDRYNKNLVNFFLQNNQPKEKES